MKFDLIELIYWGMGMEEVVFGFLEAGLGG